jgi:microcystin-dependent protein
MSYSKITSFAIKDTMVDADPLKVLRGKEFDDEFDAITVAMGAQEAAFAALVTVPTGGVLMFANPVAPAGFLPCDGAQKSRATYSALFQAIGTAYGVGDGGTTFNIPNFNGRFPYGGAIGQMGGSATSTLPAHSHSIGSTVYINDPGHAHTIGGSFSPGGGGGTGGGDLNSTGSSNVSTNGTGITASMSATIYETGVNPTNGNLPPFTGVSFIIKI